MTSQMSPPGPLVATMSASQRTLARLPLQVFEQLINDPVESLKRPEMVREAIIAKLKSFPRKTRNGVVVQSVKSVGDFLRLSIPALLRALDPLLTYGEFWRVCMNHFVRVP